MSARKRLARWAIDAWNDLRQRPLGRALLRVRAALDPLVYATWWVTTWWRTRRPTTYNQKIRYKMLHDRRPVLTTMADKVAVRDYVAERIGPAYLTKLYQVADAATDVDWSALPREFVCKVTHASGGTIIVADVRGAADALPSSLAPGHGRLVVRPEDFDAARAAEILETWRDRPYGWVGWKREWAYRDVPPRILIEEFLRGPDGDIPDDYKFMAFGGHCRLVHIDRDRHGDHRRDVLTLDWNRLPVDYNFPRSDRLEAPPARLEEMIGIAETLAQGHDFLRVDLYALPDRIVFGELTAYPASGSGTFDPPEFDRVFGAEWRVPDRYGPEEPA